MSSGIIDTIKEVALNAFEASCPVALLFGKVISADPVKIQIGELLTLTSEFLVINGAVFEGDEVSLIRCQGGQKYVVLGTRTGYVQNTVYVGGGIVGGSAPSRAVAWAVRVSNSNAHGYDQANRWGPDYDCASLIITAYEQAGIPVKSKGGAQSTHNMYNAFLKCGFKNVANSVNLSTGAGTRSGDVLLGSGHTAMVIDNGVRIVHATSNENRAARGGKTGDQTGREITVQPYYNYPWAYVLRYGG